MASELIDGQSTLGPKTFVLWDATAKEFYITEEAKQFFSNFHHYVGCVGIAGPMRKGKSFVMNRLNGRGVKGFALGRTVNPCTEGAWFWVLEPNPLTLARARSSQKNPQILQTKECPRPSEVRNIAEIKIQEEKSAVQNQIDRLKSKIARGGMAARVAKFELTKLENDIANNVGLRKRELSARATVRRNSRNAKIKGRKKPRRPVNCDDSLKTFTRNQFEHEGKQYRVILLDFEGMFDPKRGIKKYDVGLFTMACLFSSYLIYNTMCVLDAQDFEQLRLMTSVAQNLQIKQNSKTKTSQLAKHFPKLLWILRDFHLDIVDSGGNPISEKEYLETRWDIQEPESESEGEESDTNSGSDSDSDDSDSDDCYDPYATTRSPERREKERQRAQELHSGSIKMKKLFRDRDLVTLPCPVAEEEQLRNLEDVEWVRLRQSFKDAADRMVSKVYGEVRPKFLCDSKGHKTIARGPEFLAYAERVVNSVNNDQSIVFDDCFSQISKAACERAQEMAVTTYRDLAKSAEASLLNLKPITKQKFEALQQEVKVKTNDIFTEYATIGEYADRCHRATEDKIKDLLDDLKARNLEVSETCCRSFIDNLVDQIESKIPEFAENGQLQLFEDFRDTTFKEIHLPSYSGLGPWRDLCQSYLSNVAMDLTKRAKDQFQIVANRKYNDKKEMEIKSAQRRQENAAKEKEAVELQEQKNREQYNEDMERMKNNQQVALAKLKAQDVSRQSSLRNKATTDRSNEINRINSKYSTRQSSARMNHQHRMRQLEATWNRKSGDARRAHDLRMQNIRAGR